MKSIIIYYVNGDVQFIDWIGIHLEMPDRTKCPTISYIETLNN